MPDFYGPEYLQGWNDGTYYENLNGPPTSQPDYSNLYVQLQGILSAHKEGVIENEQFVQRQLRGVGGRFGTNIISGSKYVHEVKQAITEAIRTALLENYDRLIKGMSEPTGTLRQAVEQGDTIDEDALESYRLFYKLASLVRDRERPWGGPGNEERTDYYGPIVFFGRLPITSAHKMVFPAYGAGISQFGGNVETYEVAGAAAENIFLLTPAQKRTIAQSVMRPLGDIVAEQLKKMIQPQA